MVTLWAIGSVIFRRAARMRAMAPTDAVTRNRVVEIGGASDSYPPFNPEIYVLENVLPVVRLGQDSAWEPNPAAPPDSWLPEYIWLRQFFDRSSFTRWLVRLDYHRLAVARWVLILLGWAMALVLAAAITGIFKP
jgi:hypothetical protein